MTRPGRDSPFFAGRIDEVAVYSSVLSAGRILAHYQAAQPAPNQPPAALSVTKSNLDVTADATGSSDPDGTIDHYEFDFGDGTPVVISADPVAKHRYVTGDGLAKHLHGEGDLWTTTAVARTRPSRSPSRRPT